MNLRSKKNFKLMSQLNGYSIKKNIFFKVMMCVRGDRVITRPGGMSKTLARALVGNTKFEIVTAVLLGAPEYGM
jgi:hypothetical protein